MGRKKKGRKLKLASLRRTRKLVRKLMDDSTMDGILRECDAMLNKAIQDTPGHPLTGIVPMSPPHTMMFPHGTMFMVGSGTFRVADEWPDEIDG